MAGHVCSPSIFFAIRAFRKIFGFSIANYLTKNALLQKNEFPYILSRANLKSKVYYSCVGGSSFNSEKNQNHLDRVAAEIKKTDGISVRDLCVQELLATKGVNARLVPDSALVMSDIFPLKSLEERDWKRSLRKTPDFSSKNYIVFQGAKSFISTKLEDISEQLFKISKETGVSILLLPIGRATGHEDHAALEPLLKILGSRGVPSAIQDSAHVLDIMASIAFSKSYIGTSLHGAITSYSFGHKVCGIMTAKVKKLHNFVSTWMQEDDYHLARETSFADPFIKLTRENYAIKDTNMLEAHKKSIYQELSLYRDL
jgi:polysaccharide pyruvyl transferase WcaK-like protein